jgi:hypothetical protein
VEAHGGGLSAENPAGRGAAIPHQPTDCRAAAMSGLSKTLASLALIVAIQLVATRAGALPLTPFRYENQAQRHCPDDTVVWLDFRKGKYYSKGQNLYGAA